MFGAITLQRSEIISITRFVKKLFEYGPVTITARGPELALKVVPEIVLNVVVIQQCVVHIDQKDDWIRSHDMTSTTLSAGRAGTANRCEASVSSRSRWKADALNVSSGQRQHQLYCTSRMTS